MRATLDRLLAATFSVLLTATLPLAGESSADLLSSPRILVKTRPGVSGSALSGALQRSGATGSRLGWRSRTTRWSEVSLGPGEDAASVLRRLRSDPAVETVEMESLALISGIVPDDLRAYQWALDNTGQNVNGTIGAYDADIDAPEAWEMARGDRSVLVAVLDTGVHTDHPDLEGNLVPGYDFINDDGDPWDDAGVGHGTPVSGIIGAVANNGGGIAGINWEVSLMPVKVCDSRGVCPYGKVAAGIEHAVARGARILNLSLACDEHQSPATGMCGASRPGSCHSRMLRDTLAAAAGAGVLAVVSAGNCGADLDDATKAYPCAYGLDNVLCVGATNPRDELAHFSNHGARHVKVAAPGSEVLSLSIYAGFDLLWDGTSFSAPMAAGVAALQLSRNPGFTPAALASRIISGDILPALAGRVTGSARVNASAAIGDLFLPPVTMSPPGSAAPAARSLVGDFDGDGLSDICEAAPGQGHRVALGNGMAFDSLRLWTSLDPAAGELVGDFDGDGRDDIARPATPGIEVIRSSGSAFQQARVWTRDPWGSHTAAADLNGDGRADIVRYLRPKQWWVSLSDGAGFAPATLWSFSDPGSAILFADLSGDGKADMLTVKRGRHRVSLSTGDSFEAPAVWANAPGGLKIEAADMDSDGDADLVRASRGGCWEVMLSDGGSLGGPRPWSCGETSSFWSLGRLDGDSRPDLIGITAGGLWQLHRSNR